LGKGGMGEVYRADDLTLNQTVALKFLPKELAKDPERLGLFRGEVRLTRQISHPNVCRVFDIGVVDGQQFLSMEYIDGEDLASLLRRIGRLPSQKGIDTARQLCAGLAAAHEEGVLHRDLKPANIMIDGRGQVRITDFGLAQLVSENEQRIVGTPAYMAPEQLATGETTIQSDLYSLGLILYEVLTGERVHKSSSLRELRELHAESSATKLPSDLVNDMDPAVERVILRCLEREPQQRPHSATVAGASLPGGDPLAAAIAAGETPSPALVAASGETGWLSAPVAGVCLAGVALGLLLHAVIGQHGKLANRAPLERAPAVLVDKAQEIICHLGYPDPPGDMAFGFIPQASELGYVERQDTPEGDRDQWESLESGPWAGIAFWYRQASDELVANEFWNRSGTARGQITPSSDPPFMYQGHAGVRLHPRGTLRWFRAIPPKITVSKSNKTDFQPRWSEWFPAEYLGFDLDQLSPTDWLWTPPDAYDAVQAWQGTWPDTTDKFYVVAAAYRGLPVFFEVRRWRGQLHEGAAVPAQVEQRPMNGVTIAVLMLITAQVGAVILAWRNLRLGRGDRRGALRIAAYFLLMHLLAWLLQASHCRGTLEYGRFQIGLAGACGSAAIVWVFYIAMEPFVRRIWPELLISWTRLLHGRFRDARVGRDVLIGTLVGSLATGIACIFWGVHLTGRPWLGSPNMLLGPTALIGAVIDNHLTAAMMSLASLVLLLIARILLRSKWLAALCMVAIYIVIYSRWDSDSPLMWLTVCLWITAFVFVGVRYGLLSLVVAYSTLLFTSKFAKDSSARPAP
jgi:serine/threonine-protein kinase